MALEIAITVLFARFALWRGFSRSRRLKSMAGIANADAPSDGAALWRLAERLYEKMEHLDQSDGREWSELTEFERDLYYFSIKAVLLERDDVLRILAVDLPNNDMVARSLNGRK
jgi:hypothetical protein